MKLELKNKAIDLRKKGLSLSEILKQIPVAKSTLSLWFKEVHLSKTQYQRLTAKRLEAVRRGGRAKREQKIARIKRLFEKADRDIRRITKRELWLIGIALYWAEGSKEKDFHPGSGIQFGNSDSRVIQVFLKWLDDYGITRDRIKFEIYIHRNSVNSIDYVKSYWSKATGFPVQSFNRVYYKKHSLKTNRRNIGNLYYGGLRVKVNASSDLVRLMAGWAEAIGKSI